MDNCGRLDTCIEQVQELKQFYKNVQLVTRGKRTQKWQNSGFIGYGKRICNNTMSLVCYDLCL